MLLNQKYVSPIDKQYLVGVANCKRIKMPADEN